VFRFIEYSSLRDFVLFWVEKVLAFLNLFSTQILFPSKLGIANSRDPKQSERIGHFLRRELPRKV